MKNTRKIFSMLLVFILALSMAIPAFAATNDGSITINNATAEGTYNVYLMATLESSSGSSYSYKVVSGWEAFFAAHSIPVVDGYITYASGITDVAGLASAAVAYAKANSIAPTATAVVPAGMNTVKIENLTLGYYCMDSQIGTVCSLTTTNKDATVEDKNPPVVIDKTVKEDSNGTYGKINDDSIGKAVDFRLIVNKRAGAINYVMTDTMSAGLTFQPTTLKVYYIDPISSNPVDIDHTLITDFSSYQTDPSSKYYGKGYTFAIELDNAAIQAIPDGTRILADYQAYINANAVIGVAGNPNVSTIIYGNLPSESSESKTITYVWDFGILKYTLSGSTKTPLAGAKFKVLLKDTSTVPATESFLVLSKDDAATAANGGIPTYKISGAPDATGTEIETDATGKFKIIGLDSGDYWLRETVAPAGYNKLTYDVEVDIVAVGAYATDTSLNYSIKNADTDGFIGVENSTGVKLPETGSFGTFMFTLVGSIIVLSMGTLLVVRKRMTKVVYKK